MEYTFYDGNNDLGFGEDTEILVELDFSIDAGCKPGLEDPGYDPECIINRWDILGVTNAQSENINLSTLSPEKKQELNDWISNECEANEVINSCFEYEKEYWDHYLSAQYERAYWNGC